MAEMLRVWLVLLLACGWVACQPVGPNLPWLALYNGGYVSGSLDTSSIGNTATVCATIRAVELTTPSPQHLVYVGNYSKGDGFGFGLDENFKVVVWQGGAGNASTTLAVTPGVTNLVCVAYTFYADNTQARVFLYQPSFQNELAVLSSAVVAPSAEIYIGGWGVDTFTGFINNVQVYTQAFSASQSYKFSFDWKVDTTYNLLASYPFREGAGSQVYTHDGNSYLTIQGSYAWHKRFLNALNLPALNSYITLPVPSTFSGAETIAMWLKIGQASGTDKVDVFVLNSLVAFFDPLASKFGVTTSTANYTFTYTVPFDKWIFVAFQIEQSSGYIKLYVNNVQKDAYAGAVSALDASTMTIGGGFYGSLGASVASIQLWTSIDVATWGVGMSHIKLANGNTNLAAYYNLGETTGTTIYNWYSPPSQGQLTGSITWTPIPESALNLSPSDVVSFATGQNLLASSNTQFTIAMNINWRAPTLTSPSVVANVGDFSNSGFGLVIDATTSKIGLQVGYNAGQTPKLYPIAKLPGNKTTSLVVTIDFSSSTATAIVDGTTYSTGLTQTYTDLSGVNVYLGLPSDSSWSTYTGFDGLISDFQIWKGIRKSVFYVGDLQKNALVSALNPFLYTPLNDNTGGAVEVVTGTLGTTSSNLAFATFPDRTSQFNFQFPTYTPDGTLVPTANPSSPSTPTAATAPNGDPLTPANDNVSTPGVQIAVIVPAIVVPVVVVVVGLIVLLVLLKRRKKKGPKEEKKAVTIENPVNDVEAARNTFAENRSTSYSNIPMQRVVNSNNETSKNVDKLLNLAMRDRLNIPHDKIKFIEEIGSGSFGKVYKGDWQHCEVAVKVANVISNMDSFIQEAELMMAIRPHPNVVQLLGVSVDGGSPEMVLEFCPSGSLDTLLQSQVPLSDDQKVKLALGIARGMLHLHLNNIIHRDLAARNILLSKDGQPKISDFGMSRVLGEDVAHTGQTRSYVGPIKWMAPEALREAIYGRKTDVWSYGVTIWEIVTRTEPFDGVDLIQAALLIRDQGVTPEVPAQCPEVLRELMRMCWQQNPESRPEFEDICKFLQKEVK